MSTIVIGLLDVFAIGLGMGIPVFAILLGFPVGWYLAGKQLEPLLPEPGVEPSVPARVVRTLVTQAGALTFVTFVVLAIIWGPQLPTAFDASVSAKEWGVPLILYTSQASKIGFAALMMLVSPALQFMAVLTTGAIRLGSSKR